MSLPCRRRASLTERIPSTKGYPILLLEPCIILRQSTVIGRCL
jgi:hypothetical protein